MINGMDCRLNAAELQKVIGFLPGEIAFFDHMTGKGFLDFLCAMRGLEDFTKRNELIAYLELETEGRIKKMSKGMKQKLGIVAAFMHDPALYILDEPTSGLDPLMQNKFLKLIESEKKKGKTIMMSSHIFEEVERVCDRAGIIRNGRIVAIEDINALSKMKKDEFIVTLSNLDETERLLTSGLKVELVNGNHFKIEITESYAQFFEILSHFSVIKLENKKLALEDIFMKYYGEEV